MTVSEMIEKLKQFPQDYEVEIVNGFDVKFYRGDFSFNLFECEHEGNFVDIAISGTEIYS